jgi:hypothetical protein
MNNESDSDLRKEAGSWLLPHFPRLYDLYQLSEQDNPRNYFNVDYSLPLAEEEKRLARLDSKSWKVLRDKAAPYVSVDDSLRRYQQLRNILDEARGYVFLADQGYEQIKFIEQDKSKSGGKQSPDLTGYRTDSKAVLEVKTINESCDNLAEDAPWRTEAVFIPQNLSEALTRKIIATIQYAKAQLESCPCQIDRKIVFLVIRFDHGQKTGWHLYSELKDFITTQTKDGIEVYYEPLL